MDQTYVVYLFLLDPFVQYTLSSRNKATEAEIQESLESKKAAKSKVKKPKKDEHPRSPEKANQTSPNPAPQKRAKWKQPAAAVAGKVAPAADQNQLIQQLMEV